MRRLPPALGLLFLGAIDAFARAGGGQSYSGGSFSSGFSGSSSYSYGGGSSDGGDLLFSFLYLYARFVARNPLVGIPLTLFMVYTLWKIQQELRASPLPPAHAGGQLSGRLADALSRLRQRDPAFAERDFLRRAGAAFHKIQDAWSAGDMGPARAFISDGVRERFGRQLAAMKARGLRNLMERVEVRGIELLACASDAHFDELCVRIAAAASDRTVDAEGRTVAGSAGLQEFEEVWTFLRRPGAKTLRSPGLIEGNCPSCGAPLSIADAARCESCRAWVNSGEHDWVLSEITQSCEWRHREPGRDVDGWAEASAADPALSLAALEDRTSAVFWRWLDARRLGDPAPLRAVADEEACAAFKGAQPRPEAFDSAAVGTVEAVAFENDGPWRRAHVSVRWSADGELRQHFFVLRRAAEARTDPRQGLRTARCPSCGAPAAERSEDSCAYCSSPLNDGKRDWVLAEVAAYGEWKRPGGLRAPSPGPKAAVAGLDWGAELSPADAYAILARATLADGEETLAEKAFLAAYAQSRGLPAAKAEQISSAARSGRLDAPRPENGAQAEAALHGMIRVSLADGVVTDGERAALNGFAARYGLRPEDVAQMIDERRAAGAA